MQRLFSPVLNLRHIGIALFGLLVSFCFPFEGVSSESIFKVTAPLALWIGVFHFSKKHEFFKNALFYFLFFCFACFAHRVTHSDISSKAWLSYFSFSLVFLCFGVLIKQIDSKTLRLGLTGLLATINICLFLIAAIYIGHFIIFENPINSDTYVALIDTNFSETFEFFFQFLGIETLIASIALILIIGSTSVFLHAHKKRLSKKAVIILSIILVLAAVRTVDQYDEIDIYSGFWDYRVTYRAELAKFKKIRQRYDDNQIDYSATTSAKNETHILVIGEALNKNHMSLYGYPRKTTPKLDALHEAGELIKFENALSSHTHTVQTLTLALTGAGQESERKYFELPSFIDLANIADYKTAWLTNQIIFGNWDSPVSALASSADILKKYNNNVGENLETNYYDDVLLEGLKEILSENKEGNELIVLHLMGNHGDYCNRYPKEYGIFEGNLPYSIFGEKNDKFMRQINCYDNSIIFNDMVVTSVIDMLKETGRAGTVTYLADHSEHVLENKGHNSAEFDYEMVQIPFLFWASESFRGHNQSILNRIESKTNVFFLNENLYDFMIGLLKIKTDQYIARQDISSLSYNRNPENIKFVNSEHAFQSSENGYYHFKKLNNSVNGTIYGRLLPHRVNTLGKLSEVIKFELDGYETDIRIIDSLGETKFAIGHDKDKMFGLFFSDLLEHGMRASDMKIWLDVKNLTKDNLDAALSHLIELDEIYKLKPRIIFETSFQGSALKKISDAGFHTSYYLPTNRIEEALEKSDLEKLDAEAQRVSKQIVTQNLKALSFDKALYPFVKKNLEPLVLQNIIYHTWDTEISYEHENALERLSNRDYFDDERLQTILISLPSTMYQ